MVDYQICGVTKDSKISSMDCFDYDRIERFGRTSRNLFKMIEDGRPCKVVNPSRYLSKEEIEEYRKFFCKKAKQDQVNYIYYDIPVKIETPSY